MSFDPRPMSRWKAAGIHLLLSVAIAAAVVVFMLTVWYFWPLFEAAGGSHLILILVGVDVTLGPLITLIIFKSGKKGLKFDLTVIALCQLAALAYGVHTLYLARPIYIVFAIDRFELVTAKDIDLPDLEKVTRPEFKHLPLGRARYIAAVAPQNEDEKLKLIESAMHGKDVQLFPQYYVPYEQQAATALQRAKDLSILTKRDPERVRGALNSLGRTQETVKFLPMRAPQTDGAVLLDAVSGQPLSIVLIEAF